MLKKQLSRFVLSYLRISAKLHLSKVNPIIIGVGGSSGKSSLSNLIALILASKYKIRFNEGMNSETGIPLNILGIKLRKYSFVEWLKVVIEIPFILIFNWKKYSYYIAEMGIDGPFEPKNMNYLLKIIKPKIGLLTNISHEHSQYFDVLVKTDDKKLQKDKILELTANQELLLLKSLPKTGNALLNIDDLEINKAKQEIKSNKISISNKNKEADYYIQKTESSLENFIAEFIFEKKQYKVKLLRPLPNHYGKTIVFAIAVAKLCDITISESIKVIQENFVLPPGRMSIFKGIKESTIIDSSYNNATLPPILDLLEMVKKIAGKKRKVAIIGDMRELGSMSREAHEILADKILNTVDYVFLIGPLMQKYVEPILKKNGLKYQSYLTFTQAKENITLEIKNNDLILVKSSQNTLFLERVVELLLFYPNDKKKLCRRGGFWDKKRQLTS